MEDIAVLRGMPDLTIVDPCDALDIEQAVPAIAAHDGPVYMRLLRGQVPMVLDEHDYKFELGKAKLIHDGADALVVSSGFLTMRAGGGGSARSGPGEGRGAARAHHQAAGRRDDPARNPLQRLLSSHRVEPLGDRRTGRGRSHGDAACQDDPKFRQVALPDTFLDAGALPTLHGRYGISAAAMGRSIKSWL